jgi:SOS-response transcriptional repressor LexA
VSDTWKAVYDYIKAYWKMHQRSPTQREIARDLGLALGTVNHHIRMLTLHGKITMQPNRSRSIERPTK